jgi:hypothetical protein
MAQTGITRTVSPRDWSTYEQMFERLRNAFPTKYLELVTNFVQTSPTSATAVEVQQAGGLTIADAGKTNLTCLIACDTNDDAYDGYGCHIRYYTSAGVKKNIYVAFNTANTTTEVAACTDFYCWNLDDFTPATCFLCTKAVEAGDNVYFGLTTIVAAAEKRYATIAAAATGPLVATLFGVGNVFGKEETDTAGDVGLVITVPYWTPWGAPKTAHFTLAATTTNIVRLDDTTSGYFTMDFYRRRAPISTTALAGKYIAIGIDADKVVGTATLDTWYGVIEEGNYCSVHTRIMAMGTVYGKTYLGEICADNSNSAKLLTLQVTFTPYGKTIAETRKQNFFGNTPGCIRINELLAPLSEVTIKIADDAATPVDANVTSKWIEVTA